VTRHGGQDSYRSPKSQGLQVPRALLNGDLGGVALTDLSRVQPLWSGQLDMR
jgi:hypothetical protein